MRDGWCKRQLVWVTADLRDDQCERQSVLEMAGVRDRRCERRPLWETWKYLILITAGRYERYQSVYIYFVVYLYSKMSLGALIMTYSMPLLVIRLSKYSHLVTNAKKFTTKIVKKLFLHMFVWNWLLQVSESCTRRELHRHPTSSPSSHPSPLMSGSTPQLPISQPRFSCSSWHGNSQPFNYLATSILMFVMAW